MTEPKRCFECGAEHYNVSYCNKHIYMEWDYDYGV